MPGLLAHDDGSTQPLTLMELLIYPVLSYAAKSVQLRARCHPKARPESALAGQRPGAALPSACPARLAPAASALRGLRPAA